ncbi:MarC family protein [Sciscionella marina]|uniref:MarC family protein n=1 Tax=Sciscionella marina TaxID=508770 RepID=UPI000362030D|nr:MarC family protein [Sciscionella marina]
MTFFDATLFAHSLITLLVIMDAPGNIPVFLALVGRKPREVRNRAARQGVLVSFGVIAGFAIAGGWILDYLGIGIAALQGAGGLLLLIVALDLLMDRESAQPKQVEDVNIALVPLGIPLLAGPGAIATTIVFARQAEGNFGSYVAIGAAIIVAHLALYLVLRFSGALIRVLREGGIVLLAKIAGLLVAAIAVNLIATAVRGFIAGG